MIPHYVMCRFVYKLSMKPKKKHKNMKYRDYCKNRKIDFTRQFDQMDCDPNFYGTPIIFYITCVTFLSCKTSNIHT